jgi:hypothetical protein
VPSLVKQFFNSHGYSERASIVEEALHNCVDKVTYLQPPLIFLRYVEAMGVGMGPCTVW